MRVSLRRTFAAALMTAVPALAALPTPSPAQAHSPAALAPLLGVGAPNSIPGRYIVTLTPGSDPSSVASAAGITPAHVYDRVMRGFAAPLTGRQLARVRALPSVRGVEQDTTVTLPAEDRVPVATGRRLPIGAPPAGTGRFWGLERVNNRAPATHGFTVRATGAKVTAYIIDSGIDFTHPEFGGRAKPGIDEMEDDRNAADCAGHGTHVAGTVGGAHTGVARAVSLVSVRVLDCEARGPNSGIIAGINWVAEHAARPAVANISLGGLYSQTMNESLDALARSGVFPVVAAGNDDVSSCVISPASATEAFTVAATDRADHRAPFSNFGSCVNLNAPGVDIASAFPNGLYAIMSGTSMAAPHVTGIAALYKDTYGDAGFEVLKKWLLDHATRSAVAEPWGTPQLVAFTGGL
ncbi:S8 family peptidase [Actinacidiphila glaucinigra]|uniref:S8 family peptidase n=1 Tax=Actinacidiphila glaucinigra TaxID=235986 RepID=UPI0036E74DFD